MVQLSLAHCHSLLFQIKKKNGVLSVLQIKRGKNVSFAWGNWKYPKHGAMWKGKVYKGLDGEGWPPEGCGWSLRNQGAWGRQTAVNLKAILICFFLYSFSWGCFWYRDAYMSKDIQNAPFCILRDLRKEIRSAEFTTLKNCYMNFEIFWQHRWLNIEITFQKT